MAEKLAQYNKYNDRANELMSLLSKISDHYESGNINKLSTIVDIVGGKNEKKPKPAEATEDAQEAQEVAIETAPKGKGKADADALKSKKDKSDNFAVIRREIAAINKIVTEINNIKFDGVIKNLNNLIRSMVSGDSSSNADTIKRLREVVAELEKLKKVSTATKTHVLEERKRVAAIKKP